MKTPLLLSALLPALLLVGCSCPHQEVEGMVCTEASTAAEGPPWLLGCPVCTQYRSAFPPCEYGSGTMLGQPVKVPTNAPCQP